MVDGRRIGLTGGSGFIGQALKEYFLEQGYVIVDYDCDLSDYNATNNMLLEMGPPDVMIHLAGRFFGTKDELLRDNLLSTWNLLEVLSQYENVKLIFGSTGAVYGNSGALPITEMSECDPNTDNGLMKLWCEELIRNYEKKTSLSSVILRFPSVYGPNNSKGVIYHWLQDILNERKLVINGDGSQSRSFIHVGDVSSAIFKVSFSNVKGIFNVSHMEHYDLNELSVIFSKYFDFKITHADADNDLASMVLDPSKLIKEINWYPNSSVNSFIKMLS